MARNRKDRKKRNWLLYIGIFSIIGAIVMMASQNTGAAYFYVVVATCCFGLAFSKRKGNEEKNASDAQKEIIAEEQASGKKKKPIYKRWWFWLLILSLFFGGNKNSKKVTTETEQPYTESIIATEAVTDVNATESTTILPETTEAPAEAVTGPIVAETEIAKETEYQTTYVLNTSSMKFHYSYCGSADDIKNSNKSSFTGNRDDLISRGYSPCGRCHP